MPLHNPRTEIVTVYDDLARLDSGRKHQIYNSLGASQREDLWIVHLEKFLAKHGDLTSDQVSITFEALGLLQAGLLETETGSERPIATLEALRLLELRARLVFPVDLAREAFIDIASPALDPMPRRPLAGTEAARHRFQETTPSIPECDCAPEDNWCDSVTNPNPYCKSYRCIAVHGCGWFLLKDCSGLCAT